jgi:hypothetical protein
VICAASNLSSEKVRKPRHQSPYQEDARSRAQGLFRCVGNPAMPAGNHVLESFNCPGKSHQQQQGSRSMLGIAKAEYSAERGECGEPL